jgi:RNA polymerase sigma-70 factor, ECF subfamily
VTPNGQEAVAPGDAFLELYDRALPEVYGYLVRRCGSDAVAEDLTGEVFLAGVAAVQRGTLQQPTVAWLVAVARHKLVDHWRRTGREQRGLALAATRSTPDDGEWVDHLDEGPALAALARLGAHHRSALTLRYLDGLPVSEVAEHLGRTLHATEALLVRARLAFRRTYGEGADDAS